MSAPDDRDLHRRTLWRDGAMVFAAALTVRLLYLACIRDIPFFDAPTVDGAYYDAWARRIVGGEWWGGEVFFLAPAYPYFLAGIYLLCGPNLTAAHVFQMIVGAGSCALLYGAGRRFFDRRAGLIAGSILALYTPAIFYDGLIHKAALLLFLMTLLLDLLGSAANSSSFRIWLACGIVGGFLALTQENTLVFLAVVPGWILVTRRTSSITARTVTIGCFLAGMFAPLLLAAVRNFAVGSVFALTTSNMGQNFYIGNHSGATGLYEPLVRGRQNPAQEREDAIRLAEKERGRAMTPAEVSLHWLDRGFEFVRDDPAGWARLLGRKVLLVWNRFEAPDADDPTVYAEWTQVFAIPMRFLHFGLLAPLGLAGGVLIRKRYPSVGLLHGLLIALTLAIALFFVFGRYRLPLVPILALFAGAGAIEVFDRIRHRQFQTMLEAAATLIIAAVVTNLPLVDERASRSAGWLNLAAAFGDRGRFDDAARYLDRAIDAYPDNALAHYQLGLVKQKSGKVGEAEDHWIRSAAIEPDFVEPQLALARSFAAAGKNDDAIARYREVIRLRSDNESAREELTRLVGASEVAAPPPADEFEALVRAGAEAVESGRFAEAVQAFSDAAALRPDDARVHLGLAAALIAAKRDSDALGSLRRAVELNPNLTDAHAEIGRILADKGEFAPAIESYHRALALDPTSMTTQYNLAAALAATGRFDDALQAMEICLEHAKKAKRTELIPRIEDRITRLRAERDRR